MFPCVYAGCWSDLDGMAWHGLVPCLTLVSLISRGRARRPAQVDWGGLAFVWVVVTFRAWLDGSPSTL